MTEERDEKAGDCFSDDRKRCAWITPKSDQSCIAFHNEEWGVPVHDDNLPGLLPELSWKYIRFKRQSFRVSQKTMNAHEAEATAEQAVSKVEAAMTAAEEAAKEADAAEAARAYAEEASKTLEGKKTSAKW
ncbi:BnaC02g46050D [Brassica napus]|uniref:BnaC02g46050D protein n=1 Tax=Brassica napus TaxID=3708 RepID=A0A078IYH0_BRANA|nr:BnaC02g46050D [Brassica napus]